MRQPWEMFGRHHTLPGVRHVGLDRPVAWLKAGWSDLIANPLPSLAYGLLFSIGGDLVLLGSIGEPYLFLTAISGFFLVAPLLAAGLYELSRRRAAGARPTFVESLSGLKGSVPTLALFGAMLAIVIALWERITAVAFALVGNGTGGTPGFVTQLFTSGEHTAFIAIWFILGAMLALLIFALSVVSVPMMLDRNADFVTAILTSLHAFAINLEALVLWGALIVALTFFGFATFLVGLIFVMPILGHASWHAYRDLVE